MNDTVNDTATRTSNPGDTGSSPRRRVWNTDEGQVTAFVVTLCAGLFLLAGLVVDGGLTLAAKIHAINDAQSAARAGAQALDLAAYRATGTVRLMPEQASAAARAYLAAAGATGTVTVAGDTVTVTAHRTQRTQILRIAGIASLSVTGTATAVAEHGVTNPEP